MLKICLIFNTILNGLFYGRSMNEGGGEGKNYPPLLKSNKTLPIPKISLVVSKKPKMIPLGHMTG